MAVYTEISDDELARFIRSYDLGSLLSCKGIAEGVENTNYLVHTTKGAFILTLYEKRVDPKDLPFFLGLMEHLSARGVTCPLPVRDSTPPPKMKRPVGVITGSQGAAGLHALMHAQRLFRGQFDSVLIISAGEVDAEAYGGHEALERLKYQVGERCAKIVAWCRDHGMPAKVYTGFSTDAVETLEELCLKAQKDYPNVIFVATRPMTRPHGWASTLLHGGTALSLQRRLHGHDAPLIVLP